jgi:hypothetical protein
VVIAIAALFAGTQAVAANGDPVLGDGACDPSESTQFQCFESSGYVVEILPDGEGAFPHIDGSNSVFVYQITEKGSRLIKYINFLIPAAQGLAIQSSTPPVWVLFTGAKGDKSSHFGTGLTLYDTVRLDNYDGKTGVISITLQGKNVPAFHNAMGLIPNSDPRQWAKGEILLPGSPPEENAANEPTSSEKLFLGNEFKWKLLYDEGGNSFDAVCDPIEACTVRTLLVNKISWGVNGGFLDSLPIDEPFVASSSPGCTYVRTRSGAVKVLCP